MLTFFVNYGLYCIVGVGKPLDIPSFHSVFLYPWPGSWGYSPKAAVWSEFLQWEREYVTFVNLLPSFLIISNHLEHELCLLSSPTYVWCWCLCCLRSGYTGLWLTSLALPQYCPISSPRCGGDMTSRRGSKDQYGPPSTGTSSSRTDCSTCGATRRMVKRLRRISGRKVCNDLYHHLPTRILAWNSYVPFLSLELNVVTILWFIMVIFKTVLNWT